MSLADRLDAGLRALALDLSQAQRESLLRYLDLLGKWNKVYNLTAVRDPSEMLTQHLLDSLAVVEPLRRQTGGAAARLLDVGSGGGLPGAVIALCCPQLKVDCLDAVGKKAAFVQQVAAGLGLPNLRGVHGRVERAAHYENLRLPAELDYMQVPALSIEVRQKLSRHRPETLGMASRISGVTPAAISLLLVHLKKNKFKGFAEAANQAQQAA